jgi:hypothetical protein
MTGTIHIVMNESACRKHYDSAVCYTGHRDLQALASNPPLTSDLDATRDAPFHHRHIKSDILTFAVRQVDDQQHGSDNLHVRLQKKGHWKHTYSFH